MGNKNFRYQGWGTLLSHACACPGKQGLEWMWKAKVEVCWQESLRGAWSGQGYHFGLEHALGALLLGEMHPKYVCLSPPSASYCNCLHVVAEQRFSFHIIVMAMLVDSGF